MKLLTLTLVSTSLVACASRPTPTAGPDDGRAPELGDDLSIVMTSQITLRAALVQAAQTGPVIEAKFELGDDGKLSLSTYPIGAPLAMDAERSKFQELAGDPTVSPWQPGLEQFHDFEHLTRSSRDLTLVQLSAVSIAAAIAPTDSDEQGFPYWVVPTVHQGRAGYGVFTLGNNGASTYKFIDGDGSRAQQVLALGDGPGTGATDARVPELNDHPEIVRTSKITLADAIAQVEAKYGPAIEAKLEMANDGVSLSLSVYAASDLSLPAEHDTLSEASGDPTAAIWSPELARFDVPDEVHVTRATRDLTLVQTASLSLHDAVVSAQGQIAGGIAYWAVPTIRGTRAGYGVYVLAPDNTAHYFFVS